MIAVFKYVFSFIGILFLGIILFIVYDTASGAPYYQNVVTGKLLSEEDVSYIKKTFQIENPENIISISSINKNIKDGGVLFNKELIISSVAGDNLETSLHSKIEDIIDVKIKKSESFVDYSIITVLKSDSTYFSFEISSSDHVDTKFFERLLNLVKTQMIK